MILTDYYKFVHLTGAKSKTRLDCIASTQSHDAFEMTRTDDNRLWVYVSSNNFTKAGQERKADLAVTGRKGFISSIYVPDIERVSFGYGDLHHTADALLFVINGEFTDAHYMEGSTIEVFAARGMRANVKGIFNLLIDDDESLLSDMQELRAKAIQETQERANV